MKKIKIGDTEYQIKKMPLGRYAKFLKALEDLPSDVVGDLMSADQISNEKFVQKLPSLLRKSYGQLIEVLHIATEVPKDVLNNQAGMLDATRLIKAVIEVNEYMKVKNAISGIAKDWRKETVSQKKKTG